MVLRRRLVLWLFKAYLKKWGKSILISFLLGCAVFFLIIYFGQSLISKFPVFKKETIGLLGDRYQVANLPLVVQKEFSKGLTYISQTGEPKADVASKWEIKNNGKKYVFYLRPNSSFTDGTPVTSKNVAYNFSDAKIEHPKADIIVFNLKETYAPFLTTISRPFYKSGFVGVGKYKVKDVDVNGIYVKSITLAMPRNDFISKVYKFYSTEDQLKLAFVLGEISKALGLSDPAFKNTSFQDFPNVTVIKKVNYEKVVTIFYNTQDPLLSDNKLRDAFSYTIPDQFKQGEKTYIPYSPISWAFQDYSTARKEDLEHAKLLIKDVLSNSKASSLSVTIKTLAKYKTVAGQVAREWKKIGVKSKITVVESVPDQFQVFLGDFRVPTDPDQYFLWHSGQASNITKYENKRIDLLLEQGRKTVNTQERKKIYADFLKYFLADSPASFLYFPYEYDVARR